MDLNGKKILSNSKRNALQGLLFVSPWILGFCLFIIYPLIYSIVLSLNAVQIRPDGIIYEFKGLFYYDYALNANVYFRDCLAVQVSMIGYMTPIVLVFSLIIALLLNKNFRFRTLYRVIFFLPVIIMSGPVISNLLSSYAIDIYANVPLIYKFLGELPEAVGTPVKYVLDHLVTIIWLCGVQILIFLTGIHRISPDLYEAASIDGAGAWEKFWKITLPHLSPMILICAVYTVVDIANFSEGGNVNALIKSNIFNAEYPYSYASAIAWMYFIVVLFILVVVFLIFKFFGRKAN